MISFLVYSIQPGRKTTPWHFSLAWIKVPFLRLFLVFIPNIASLLQLISLLFCPKINYKFSIILVLVNRLVFFKKSANSMAAIDWWVTSLLTSFIIIRGNSTLKCHQYFHLLANRSHFLKECIRPIHSSTGMGGRAYFYSRLWL